MENPNIYSLNERKYSKNNNILFSIVTQLEKVINDLNNNSQINNIIIQLKNIIIIINNAINNNKIMLEEFKNDVKKYHYEMNNKLINLEKIISNMNQNNINNFNNLNNNINKNINWNMNNNKINNVYNNMNIFNNRSIFDTNNYNTNNFINPNNFISYCSTMKNLAKQKFSDLLNEKYIKLCPLISFTNDNIPYFNSAIQCLLNIPELNLYFINYFNSLGDNIISRCKISKEYL